MRYQEVHGNVFAVHEVINDFPDFRRHRIRVQVRIVLQKNESGPEGYYESREERSHRTGFRSSEEQGIKRTEKERQSRREKKHKKERDSHVTHSSNHIEKSRLSPDSFFERERKFTLTLWKKAAPVRTMDSSQE